MTDIQVLGWGVAIGTALGASAMWLVLASSIDVAFRGWRQAQDGWRESNDLCFEIHDAIERGDNGEPA